MSTELDTSIDGLMDAVTASMQERVFDIQRAQGKWPFPRWEQGRVVKLRIVKPPFDISKAEEALL